MSQVPSGSTPADEPSAHPGIPAIPAGPAIPKDPNPKAPESIASSGAVAPAPSQSPSVQPEPAAPAAEAPAEPAFVAPESPRAEAQEQRAPAPAAPQAPPPQEAGGSHEEPAEHACSFPADVAHEHTGNGQPTVIVRYGLMRQVGQFRHNLDFVPSLGTKVVARTERGVEVGEVLFGVSEEPRDRCMLCRQLKDFISANGPEYPFRRDGRILRIANSQDLIDFRHLENSAREERAFCRQQIREMKLDMKLVTVEHLLGGERIIFYFTAETRVDFRDLVRHLASQYRTRIEMRQVGARDEARLVADFERCGQRCCCQQYLKDLKPVSMRMAKIQKATLDPSKISGRCGRLMCCLRYEDETYEDLRKKLPHKNIWVRTADKVGRVVDTHIISQLVSLWLPDNTLLLVANEEILERDVPAPPMAPEPQGGVVRHGHGRPPSRSAIVRGEPVAPAEPEEIREPSPGQAPEAEAASPAFAPDASPEEGAAESPRAAEPIERPVPQRQPAQSGGGRPQGGGQPRGQRQGDRQGDRQGGRSQGGGQPRRQQQSGRPQGGQQAGGGQGQQGGRPQDGGQSRGQQQGDELQEGPQAGEDQGPQGGRPQDGQQGSGQGQQGGGRRRRRRSGRRHHRGGGGGPGGAAGAGGAPGSSGGGGGGNPPPPSGPAPTV